MGESCPLVSVLVPLYNHARYVRRCLDSVLEDGYPRIEIIIIDDGSKDDSAALARRWFEEQNPARIESFELISRPNKGVTRTVNELIGKARGEYLVLLASDDFLLPEGITTRLGYLRSHPDKLAVFSDCIVADDSGAKTHESGIANLYKGHVENLMNDNLLPVELIFNWCVPGPGFMAHQTLFERVGLYDESLAVEDWDMYLRILAQGLLGFIPRPSAAYRWHGSNSVSNKAVTLKQYDSLMRTAWKNHQFFKGTLRFGMLYRYYHLRQDCAALRGAFLGRSRRRVYKLLCRPIFNLVYRLTVLRYRRPAQSNG
jgi:glycosyltransferase involved in cell wall biosynthesis